MAVLSDVSSCAEAIKDEPACAGDAFAADPEKFVRVQERLAVIEALARGTRGEINGRGARGECRAFPAHEGHGVYSGDARRYFDWQRWSI